jgi:DNA repair exonuclease SbcCD ATPase subunit
MIEIRNLTVKNFMSVGNATQAINFDRKDLTLVLGENLDLGGDGSRNGTGKTTIINALSYALFGNALTNIRKDNLINGTNGKNMLVSLEFSVSGVNYKIERGRKSNVLRFFVDDQEQEITDDSQGDSRETQKSIEDIIGMTHDMFKHILALNTYTEPFLSLKANDQRSIIEQLLGVTLLSEKADKVKELTKATKDLITQEDFKVKAVQEANLRIQEQIDNVKRRQILWSNKKEEDINKLSKALDELSHLDITAEIESHKSLAEFYAQTTLKNNASNEIKKLTIARTKEIATADKLTNEITTLLEHKCYACGQDMHDEKHETVKAAKENLLVETLDIITDLSNEIVKQQEIVDSIGELKIGPTVYYDTVEEAYNHRSSVETLTQQLTTRFNEEDPYSEQVAEMESKALQEVSYDKINELTRMFEHQDFLLKLLTNKDSFIRKKIIDQNLSYLNSRLSYYLEAIGLPHEVVFQNDLTVMITELGRDLDFDNLSRGERNRLILSMSWAFRDVWESLYMPINLLFVDELIDSGMDSAGVDNSIAILKKMVRERSKSIWLVSHRDELTSRVEHILKVVKENGFTSYNTDIEDTKI